MKVCSRSYLTAVDWEMQRANVFSHTQILKIKSKFDQTDIQFWAQFLQVSCSSFWFLHWTVCSSSYCYNKSFRVGVKHFLQLRGWNVRVSSFCCQNIKISFATPRELCGSLLPVSWEPYVQQQLFKAAVILQLKRRRDSHICSSVMFGFIWRS